jgi:hypothetical protein
MTDSRIVTIRKSINIRPELVSFPLVFIGPQSGFPLESILRKLQSDIYLGHTTYTFPNTIQEYFLTVEGVPGKEPWIALGTLTGGVYFLFTAYMTHSIGTFLKNGHMNLWVSTNFSDIINYAMDATIYNTYMIHTQSIISIV